MSSLFKNLFVALGIALLLGGVYYVATSGSDEEFVDDGAGMSDTDVSVRTQKILADTRQIDEYALDVSIFEDQRFRTLVDYTVSIPDVSTGRANPFAPVE
ncbi:hypothetical protein IPH92_03180 [Candidatus Kaiserbacteria bacterium]|nr:MAG: hypothetical protein IPH92_03180 [Candidatus Kaiserbacteria bacterium]